MAWAGAAPDTSTRHIGSGDKDDCESRQVVGLSLPPWARQIWRERQHEPLARCHARPVQQPVGLLIKVAYLNAPVPLDNHVTLALACQQAAIGIAHVTRYWPAEAQGRAQIKLAPPTSTECAIIVAQQLKLSLLLQQGRLVVGRYVNALRLAGLFEDVGNLNGGPGEDVARQLEHVRRPIAQSG